MMRLDMGFYRGRRVLLTGHTGFKGSWMSRMLIRAGAELTGYSRCSEKEYSLFELAGLKGKLCHVKGDIRDLESLKRVFAQAQPEIVIHMAAQPIVRDGYADPVTTYETNVLGTLNVLECVRLTPSVKSVVNVTTDKVYQNNEWVWGYRETDPLDGYDPYANSKSCSELITHSYCNSFFKDRDIAVSTARAGNVIGGGDFARDRIIPDCVRAAVSGKTITVRNPRSIRPYQHVLEPVTAYLMIAARQAEDPSLAGCYNIGPDAEGCVRTEQLVDLFCKKWGRGLAWEKKEEPGARHESQYLKLDCSKIKSVFGWQPGWRIEEAVEKVCEWTDVWLNTASDGAKPIGGGYSHEELSREMDAEIEAYLETQRGS